MEDVRYLAHKVLYALDSATIEEQLEVEKALREKSLNKEYKPTKRVLEILGRASWVMLTKFINLIKTE